MKRLMILLLILTSLNIYAQKDSVFDGHTWQAPYHLSIPKDWTIERFLIPIGFAPQIPYKGVEDIRFAPGWAKVKSDEYWSYAFLWYLDGTPKTGAAIIAQNLKAYYSGLVKVNIDNAKHKDSLEKLTAATTSFKKIETQKGDDATFQGTINMIDYMQLKPITLNCIAHIRPCVEEKKTIIFYELSPQPFEHSIWRDLDKLWTEFSCKRKI